jgi:NaMN:DMB phosphoribosyltransferase
MIYDRNNFIWKAALKACPDHIAFNLKGVELQAEIIEKALRFHAPDPGQGLEILRKIGGYEIAGIAGANPAAASKRE